MSGPVLTGGRPVLPEAGVGWPLLPLPDAEGALAWPDAPLSVRQMIEVILRTAPGELLMRPGFGAGTEALLHGPNTSSVRARAQAAIAAALTEFEPRIVLDDVSVEAGADAREVVVGIRYRLVPGGEAGLVTALVPVAGAG